jgi:hypothetical protein
MVDAYDLQADRTASTGVSSWGVLDRQAVVRLSGIGPESQIGAAATLRQGCSARLRARGHGVVAEQGKVINDW